MVKAVYLILCSILFIGHTDSSYSQSRKPVVTNELILELHRANMNEADLVALVRKSICRCDTSSNAVASLRREGVPIAVISEMMAIETKQQDEVAATPESDSEDLSKWIPADETTLLSQIEEPGIYLHDFGRLKLLEPTVFSGARMNPMVEVLSIGAVKARLKAKVRGKGANVFFRGSRPVFYFAFSPALRDTALTMSGLFWGLPAASPNEFVMVQMDVKQASREATLFEFSRWTGGSMGVPDKSIREFKFEKIRPGLYRVIPIDDLPAGEYSFYFAASDFDPKSGAGKLFDFGVRK